jgi:hypothetical protein
MKDPEIAISQAYYTILHNLIAGGATVPFYNVRPRTAARPFMLLVNPNIGDQESDKEKNNNLVLMTIDLQDETSTGTDIPGSRLREKQIAAKIVEAITEANMTNLTAGFNVVTSILRNKQTLDPETQGSSMIFRTLLTFEHWVESL